MKNKLLEIINLNKVYHTEKNDVLALENISFDVYENEFISIVGPSGCGKSTILSILANLEDKTDGTIKFFKDLSDDRLMTPSGFSETHSRKRNAVITPNLGTLSVTMYGTNVVISAMSDSIKKLCSTFEKILFISM